jgi:hypothetical protein
MLVRIVRNYTNIDLMRQTPGGRGIWDGIQFTCDPVDHCDYVIVLNYASQDTAVHCQRDNIWALMQEPPNEVFSKLHRGCSAYGRVYTSDGSLENRRYVHCHPAIPWHVERDYEFLTGLAPFEKSKKLSWVTGSGNDWKGHRVRMQFLKLIQNHIPFDLFGRGFEPISFKWDGLAPYRYSIAFENFSNEHYWSEKIADCFLTWTMPIYFGCTRITDYFPAESMIQIDPDDPDVVEKIREAIETDAWKRNRDAIAHARELVIQKYQLFPLMAREIQAQQIIDGVGRRVNESITIPGRSKPPLSISRAAYLALYAAPAHALWRAGRKLRHLRGQPV